MDQAQTARLTDLLNEAQRAHGEYGQVGKPDEFAAKLREVLSAAS